MAFFWRKKAFQVGFSIREEVPREREKVRGEFISLGKTEEGKDTREKNREGILAEGRRKRGRRREILGGDDYRQSEVEI